MMLDYKLGRDLAGIAGEDAGMDHVVFALLQASCGGGWVEDLVRAAARHRPDHVALHRWARSNLHAAADAPPAAQQTLDTAFFDLSDLRRVMEETLDAVEAGPLAFGVTYPELAFVTKVCDWLPYCLGQLQRKEPLNLRPEFVPVARQVQQVARYRRDLESTSVVCPVLAEGVPAETVDAFWAGVRNEFAELKHRLVLIFTGYPETVFPDGVTVLPPPRFDRYLVRLWAREVVAHRGWPPVVAEQWTRHIIDEADDGGGLDVRAVYEAMDRSINEVRFDPEGFRLRLEQLA
jgi:hypothetical protein